MTDIKKEMTTGINQNIASFLIYNDLYMTFNDLHLQYTPVSRPVITPTSPATLSALMDISNEQKTISDLRYSL